MSDDEFMTRARAELARWDAMPDHSLDHAHGGVVIKLLGLLLDKLERDHRIAHAAAAFVDEQGKRALVGEQRSFSLADAGDFAGGEFAALVAAVEGAGR